MDLKPDSYKQNQIHLKGTSTNLYDANLLDHYLYQAQHDRRDKEKLKERLMGIVYECLGNINKSKKYTRLPDDEEVIRNCQNVIYNMPVPEMRELLSRITGDKLNDVKKIKAVLEYL